MTCCQYCGGPVEWTNNAGWYRDFCKECAQRVADGEELTPSYDPDDEPVSE